MADTSRDPTVARRPSTPRWVKVGAVAAVIAILLVVLVMAIGGGEHGPGRHSGRGARVEALISHRWVSAVAGPWT